MRSILKQLEALGLSENEVKVYLASLELGSATAQELAGKAAVVRPTAYVAIGGLTKRGLMSSFTKGKKKYFTAEKPAKLLKLVQEEKKKLTDREEKLKRVMPELEALISLSADKPEVKYYEGLEGLDSMRAVLYESKIKTVDVVGETKTARSVIPEDSRLLHSAKLEKLKIGGRYIVLSNENDFELPPLGKNGWEYKLYKNENVFGAEIAIFGPYISFISYQDKPYGFMLKSENIAKTARLMFEAMWNSRQARSLRSK